MYNEIFIFGPLNHIFDVIQKCDKRLNIYTFTSQR